MTNRDIRTAWKYHEGTKHSYWSVRSSTHFLDWANRPLPFKIYPAIEAIALPRDVPQTGVAALAVISEQVRAAGGGDVGSDLPGFARILFFFAGGSQPRKNTRGGKFFFGAAWYPTTSAIHGLRG